MPDRQQLMLGFGCLPRLLSLEWWRFLFAFVMALTRHLLKPSMMLALGMTLPIVGFDLSMRPMTQHGTFYGLGDVLSTLGLSILVIFVCTVGALVMVIWGLGSCFIVLTGLCRSFLTLRSMGRTAGEKTAIVDSQNQAIAHFVPRKSYLVTVWLMYSIYMIVPFILMSIAGALVIVMSGMMPALPASSFPNSYRIIAAITLGITIIVMSNYALVLLPLSSVSNAGGRKTATDGLLLSLRVLPAISMYSALVFFMSSFLGAPVELLLMYDPSLEKDDLVKYGLLLAKLVWHVVFFLLLTPATLLVPCEMIRDAVGSGNEDKPI